MTSAHFREPAYAAWCKGVQPSLFLDLTTAARVFVSEIARQKVTKRGSAQNRIFVNLYRPQLWFEDLRDRLRRQHQKQGSSARPSCRLFWEA
jgi:hypothetical protein